MAKKKKKTVKEKERLGKARKARLCEDMLKDSRTQYQPQPMFESFFQWLKRTKVLRKF